MLSTELGIPHGLGSFNFPKSGERQPHCAGGMRSTYTFQSAPKMTFGKHKFKSEDQTIPYGNVMYDRRVVRGPAFIQHPIPTVGGESQAARQAEARRRAMARRRAQTQKTKAIKLSIATPPPVDGRKHEDIQTEDYLVELFDKPLEMSFGTQTDFHVDCPSTPLYIPDKTGLDEATQIYPGELFHFDTEVKPMLEVIVGKTIEQSLIEVMEEEELASIREQQRKFQEARDAEKFEEQRLEEQERRKREEALRRIAEEEEEEKIQKEMEDRVAAGVLSLGFISDLLPKVISGLKDSGYVVDEVKEEVEDNFMSWLLSEVKSEIEKMVSNRDLLSEMIREILETRAEIYRALGESEAKRLGDESEEENVESPPLPPTSPHSSPPQIIPENELNDQESNKKDDDSQASWSRIRLSMAKT